MTRHAWRWTLILLPAALVAACATLPPALQRSGLEHLHAVGLEGLMHLNPVVARAAEQYPQGVTLSGKKAAARITLNFDDGSSRQFVMPLELVKAGPSLGAASGPAQPGMHWYLFRLSPKGVKVLKNLKSFLRPRMDSNGNVARLEGLHVALRNNGIDLSKAYRQRVEKSGKMPWVVRLKLTDDYGYFTVINGTVPFTVTHDSSGSAAQGSAAQTK